MSNKTLRAIAKIPIGWRHAGVEVIGGQYIQGSIPINNAGYNSPARPRKPYKSSIKDLTLYDRKNTPELMEACRTIERAGENNMFYYSLILKSQGDIIEFRKVYNQWKNENGI